MSKLIFIKRHPTALVLIPTGPYDQEQISTLSIGPDYSATMRAAKGRSKKQNDFYWKLLAVVAANNEREGCSTAPNLHRWLKKKLGYYKEIKFWDGNVLHLLDSTSFTAMDAIEFKPYLDSALDLITLEVIPGMRRKDLVNEVERMLGYSLDSLWNPELAA